ncbi:VOC family protein [uncultured Jatrophihabitans sp.]|uniref:VOC family protein n=1 Tax=uncultured Jatrophihabitans sp. TaxID=1610747 RepID=UPI0035C9F712
MTPWHLTVDCHDPQRMVAFWSAALGYVPAPPPAGFATWHDWYVSVGVPADELGDGDNCDRLVDPTGVGPRIWFQVVPETKTVKNRLHLDLDVTGGRTTALEQRRATVDAKVAELVVAGAQVLRRADGDTEGHYAATLADPEGNEFCVS